jgi:transcriptional regulator GlxA family with amidase domain
VCIPDIFVAPREPLAGRFEQEIEWLKHCYREGAIVAAACSGTLLLAEAGLLNNMDATTHWGYCDVLQERYPSIRVHPRRALVASGDEQRLVMAGGGTSWQDLTLFLIARLAGLKHAQQLARIYLIDWHQSGQQPYAMLARSRQVEDPVIGQCQQWIAEHYTAPSPVAAMAQLSGLQERSFKRRFQKATGLTPLQYVQTLRLEEAKHLLESGDQPVEAIAGEVGYEDTSFFCRLFRREVGLTATQYRRRFGALRKSLNKELPTG